MQWILEEGVYLSGTPESGCGVLRGTGESKWFVNVYIKDDGKGVECFGPYDTKEDAMNKGEEEHKSRSITETCSYFLI